MGVMDSDFSIACFSFPFPKSRRGFEALLLHGEESPDGPTF
jgi:hypothetical protein